MEVRLSFNLYRENEMYVEAVGWGKDGSWHWNVYLHISSESELYNVDSETLPFHCGATYDKKETDEPFVMECEWQKKYTARKIGSDYSHLYDDFTNYSPFDGIPAQIENDANSLIEAIKDD